MIQTPELVLKHYSLPFKYSGYSYVWDSDSHMCLMSVSNATNIDDFMNVLVRIMNGESIKIHPKEKFTLKEGEIFLGELKLIIIRGWGRLQYITEDDPATIQDTFSQWVVDVLNDNIENETV